LAEELEVLIVVTVVAVEVAQFIKTIFLLPPATHIALL
jgi:hypothetical protein